MIQALISVALIAGIAFAVPAIRRRTKDKKRAGDCYQ